MNKKLSFQMLISLVLIFMGSRVFALEYVLSMEEFISVSTQKDTEFESILIDQLLLKHQKDLNLPAKDLVVGVKTQYNFILSQNREDPLVTLSLTKLFPFTGTDISADYSSKPSFSSVNNSSFFTFSIAQPIAENAFGKGTRLHDQIIGVEIDVIKYQIAEAYEDYLATITGVYLSWYEAYENLKIAKSSYKENLKLMDNVKGRQKSSIALPIDVNKINLQLLTKKEKLVNLREEYQRALNFIKRAFRYEGMDVLIPQRPQQYSDLNIVFEDDFDVFKKDSRTYDILHLLEEKSSLEVDKNANDLLPSINLLFGYTVDGDQFQIKNEDHMVFAGVSMDWPLGNQVERAAHEISKINLDKTRLASVNTHFYLYMNIRNLSEQIDREKQLVEIAQEKIDLALDVLKAEAENYSYGKVSINDYIDAVNVVDNHRFNEILHEVQYKKLLVEWLRITDQMLVSKELSNEENIK